MDCNTTTSSNTIENLSEAMAKTKLFDAESKPCRSEEQTAQRESLNVKDIETCDDAAGSTAFNSVSKSNNKSLFDMTSIKGIEYYWSTWSQIPPEYAWYYNEKPWLNARIARKKKTTKRIGLLDKNENLNQHLEEGFNTIQEEKQREQHSTSKDAVFKEDVRAIGVIENKNECIQKQIADNELQQYLKIRDIIMCPQDGCKRNLNVSDFPHHLITHHKHLPKDVISPLECKKFYLDTQSINYGITKCYALYLLENKITNVSGDAYKNFLPLLVMASRINFTQPLNNGLTLTEKGLLIWIVNVIPEEVTLPYTLNVLENTNPVPKCYAIISSEAYSVRKSQNAIDVLRSGLSLVLSEEEVNTLTNGGRHMLCLQLKVDRLI